MEQNKQYLYEYQDGKRVRNIGFMKIDKQMDKCYLQIYAKQIDAVKGILFQREDGEVYMSGWEPELLELEKSRDDSREQPVMTPQPNSESELLNVTQQLPDTPQMPRMPQTEDVDDYIMPKNVTYEKIKRQDLSRLPRKEWRIANNSFLLHGFYNYHHLLYIEDDGKIWIGVPGIYHEKEKMAANSFGFTEFRRMMDVDISLEENEKNTYEDFGYWCKQVNQT